METTTENRPDTLISAGGVLAIFAISIIFSLLGRRLGEDGTGGTLAALAGVVLALVVVWATQRRLGLGFAEIGLRRPVSWPRTIGQGILVALIIVPLAYVALEFVINPLTGSEGPDISRFDSSRASLGMMIGTVVTVWLTSAFPEEVLWRGFLMTRIAKLAGATRWAWALALVVSSVHFGLLHYYQGISGVAATGFVGLLYGVAFLILGRNLWVTIVAHATSHVISFTALYLGLV